MVYQIAEKASKSGGHILVLFINVQRVKKAADCVVSAWKSNCFLRKLFNHFPNSLGSFNAVGLSICR